jgi:hypothetical protein
MIEYILAENRGLRVKLGKKRIMLNDNQRRRLAVKGKVLGNSACCLYLFLPGQDTMSCRVRLYCQGGEFLISSNAAVDVVRHFWRLMATNDFQSVGAVLAPDYLLEWLQ